MDKHILTSAEISLEELTKMVESNIYGRIHLVDEAGKGKDPSYSPEKMLEIKKAILKYIENAPKKDPANPKSELEIFTYIYTKMAHTVKYDEFAVTLCDLTGYDREQSEERRAEAEGYEGAMLHGRALCSGYSDTLSALLSECGIKSRVMSGGPKNRGEAEKLGTASHAWNQVYLDGKWYNCDITNDADFILEGLVAPFFLKSNSDFKPPNGITRYEKYPLKYQTPENATESISAEEQRELIEKFEPGIIQELTPKEPEKVTKKPGFLNTLKAIFAAKSVEKGAE